MNSLRMDNSMRSSFDIGEFLEEKEFDIVGKTYKGRVATSIVMSFPLCYCSLCRHLPSHQRP